MNDENDAGAARSLRPDNGTLAPYIDGFAEFLGDEGYSPRTAEDKCSLVAHLGRWLDRREMTDKPLDEAVLDQFHASLRRSGYVRRGDVATGRQLLRYLRHLGYLPTPLPRNDRSPVDELTEDFGRFLSSERGLSPATLINYLPIIRSFLTGRSGRNTVRLDELHALDIQRFVQRYTQATSRRSAQLAVTALRSFLRYLRQRGEIASDLAGAVPSVACWSLSGLPKFLPATQVEQLLASCDRVTPVGNRDYAVLLLLARLGLRAGEVVTLTLDDLDWENGDILIRGKGKRLARLPLPPDVGAALVNYLRGVRPACSTRRVFIRMRAPLRGLTGPAAIDCIVCRALKRTGLTPKFKGAHLLRHSLATNLLRNGASLTEIGQLLRHRQPNTTQIYAKVDIESLRGIAMTWPGGAS